MSNEALSRSVFIEVRRLAHTLIRGAYRGVRGIEISKAARQERELEDPADKSLTYGEVTSTSFEQLIIDSAKLVDTARKPGERIFVDLGSGTGKALLTVAFGPNSHGFVTCKGVELLPELNDAARKAHGAIVEALNFAASGPAPTPSTLPPVAPAVGNDRTLSLLLHETRDILTLKGKLEESEVANALLNSSSNRKAFKTLIKARFKTFRKFLLSHKGEFCVSEDDSCVSLVSSGSGSSCVGDEEGPVDGKEGAVLEEVEEKGDEDGDGDAETASGDDLPTVVSRFPSAAVQHALSRSRLTQVSFLTGSIFDSEVHWQECDVAYAASLLFTDEMMALLAEKVRAMPVGSVFLSLKPLPEASLGEESRVSVTLYSKTWHQMSWQKALVYVYRCELPK